MARRKKRNLPKWKLKANWLLRELARIWYGKTEPYPLFEGENFFNAFTDIILQSVLDLYNTEKEAWLDPDMGYRLEILFYGPAKPDASCLTQVGRAREMLVLSVKILNKWPFAKGKTILNILWLANEIEARLKSGDKPPYKPIKRIRDLSYYENLPVLPID